MKHRILTASLGSRIGLLILIWVVFSTLNPKFFSPNTMFAVLEGFAITGLVAAGLATTMLVGELDLSVGSVAAVAGIIAVESTGLGFLPAVLLAVVAALVFGLTQGWIIARTGINSLVFTIGTLILVRGIAFVITPVAELMPLDRIGMSDFLVTRLWIFSPFSLTTLTLVIILGLFLAFSRWGREMMAFGGARDEARAAGLNMRRPIIIAFGISATFAGLAGALASIKSASAAPFSYEGLLLTGVTAALVGGVSLYGGKGTMLGVVVGALILRSLTAGIANQGAAVYIESLAIGVILLLVLLVEFFTESPQKQEWSARRAFDKQLSKFDSKKAYEESKRE